MSSYDWYQISGVASLVLTGLTAIWNRRSIRSLSKTIDNLPSEEDQNQKMLELLDKELKMIKDNEKKIENHTLEINNAHDKITLVFTKLDELDKKCNSCKRKVSSVEKKTNETLNEHGLQMSTVNQQLAAVESVYRDQLDLMMEEMKQVKSSLSSMNDKIEALERDRLLFAGMNANSVQQVEELLNRATTSLELNEPLTPKQTREA